MAKIRWSKDSLDDLKEICQFIALDSPYYAKLLNDRIFEMVEHLEYFPEMGRHVPESDDPSVRELIYKNHRIIYQTKDAYLEIITVIHGSRLLKFKHSESENGEVHGARSSFLCVPSEGYCLLAGESPVMAKAGSHVAWMAGDRGNAVF